MTGPRDIVERLEELARSTRRSGGSNSNLGKLAEEAAGKIVRLRTELLATQEEQSDALLIAHLNGADAARKKALEEAAGVAQMAADQCAPTEKNRNNQARAIRRTAALTIREAIMLAATTDRAHLRKALRDEGLEAAARVADARGWEHDRSKCSSYDEGRKDAADSIAAAIRALKGNNDADA